MLKVALTHDVDRVRKTYHYLTHSLRSLLHLNGLEFFYHLSSVFLNNPYWNFPEIIRIENYYEVKSTFFFLNETLKFQLYNPRNWVLSLGRYRFDQPEIRKIIRWLDQNGWEVGLHGSFNSFTDKKLLAWERQLLEEILGHEVLGIRQHHLNLDRQKTWTIQQALGFKYDATWGSNYRIGFKKNHFRPFHPFDDEFMVIPMLIMDSCFMATKNKWVRLQRILDNCEEKDAVFVINWHQCVFNEKEYPGYTKNYRLIIEECLKRNASFSSMSEVYNNYSLEPINV